MRAWCLLAAYAVALVVACASAGQDQIMRWTVPHWWLPGALCVHRHESYDWHLVDWPYFGGMQFEIKTWWSVGGRGSIYQARWSSPAEQLYRAYRVWRRDGGSWREWPTTSRICGLQ